MATYYSKLLFKVIYLYLSGFAKRYLLGPVPQHFDLRFVYFAIFFSYEILSTNILQQDCTV